MAAHVSLTLDTTAPGGVSVSIAAGAPYTVTRDVVLTIGTSDGDTTGYEVKIYGDVDDSFAPSEYRAAEGDAPWVSYAASKNVRLSATDGSKTVRIKIRDDVHNASSEATDAITLDTSLPVVTVTSGPDRTRVSEQVNRRVATFAWQSDVAFEEYKVKVVPASNSPHSAGTQIPTTNGSTNVSGNAGGYPATTNISTAVDGRDLKLADTGDGAKVVKVFVLEASGNWSS